MDEINTTTIGALENYQNRKQIATLPDDAPNAENINKHCNNEIGSILLSKTRKKIRLAFG